VTSSERSGSSDPRGEAAVAEQVDHLPAVALPGHDEDALDPRALEELSG
jgi:hypothetical protein